MSALLPWMQRWLGRARGISVVVDLAPYRRRLAEVDRHRGSLAAASDAELIERARRQRARATAGASPEELEGEVFALVREASDRVLGLRPFDVQVLAGLAMRDGNVVEMATGEGKTLAAVFPTYLEGLSGAGAHVLTFNDYLARRDAEWMGPLYRFLGLTVGVVQDGMDHPARRRAYAADVTYLTAKEAGFDLLRDSLCNDPVEMVRRSFRYALVDEADSLMIDEARVPLVIAGSLDRPQGSAYRMAEVVRRLEAGVHYETDEYGRAVDLTETGRERAQEILGCGDLLADDNLLALTEIHCALHAAVLLTRDVDYILRDGRIKLVDEFTGRVIDDRHWPDGLQAALEAKENLALGPEGQVLGSVTLQHFLRLYPRLCGMTGTALPAAGELKEHYGLDVVVIPPHRECIRRDLPDLVFTHREAKTRALVEEIGRVHATGRPVLVGTLSVAESEELAGALERSGIRCDVLNARTDELEAEIVAGAGAPGAVTISTNMAGRGTDIRLGGAREEERDRVVALGGLYVIGTNRHESVRIDRQLRGRAGRQGDPGATRLFLSLEDELIVRYGIERLIPAKLWPPRQEGPLDNPVIRREIARAQRIVEGQNVDIRRTLWRYSELVEGQRKLVQRQRGAILRGRAPSPLAAADPGLRASLVESAGEEGVRRAERQAALYHLDRGFSEHLGGVADIREGIHLLRVGGRDPLTEFLHLAVESFREMRAGLDGEIIATLRRATITSHGLDLETEGLRGPSSTWTYLVDDDPFRGQLGIQLTGNTGLGAAAALYTGPLIILWSLYRHFRKNR